MKKLILLLIALGAAFVIYNRQRLFLRDPMGAVTRAGKVESGTQVFINFSNDVLLENDNSPMYVTVIQKREPQVVGAPKTLKCAHWLVCMTDADLATLVEPAEPVEITQQTSKLLAYRDAQGREVQVKLW